MKPWVIYTLSDPRTPEDVRYVGVTHRKPRVRLSAHLHASKKYDYHLSRWVRKLSALGLVPSLNVIDRGVDDGWQAAEKKWIRWHRDQGSDLVNATDGGQGGLGHTVSQEARARMRVARVGKTLSTETKAKIGAAGRGRKHTPETRAQMSESRTGKKLSRTTIESMAAGRVGVKQSPERVARRIAAVKATWAKKKAAGWVAPPDWSSRIAPALAANKGRECSPETRAKIAAANKGRGQGRKLSPETRAKMSEAQRVRQEARP